MHHKSSIIWKYLPVVALCLSMTKGVAQNKSMPPVNRDGVVAVGGVSILTIRFPAAGLSVKQRAGAVTDRLTVILADPVLKPADVVVVPQGKNAATIMVKNHLLVTIDQETARFNSTTPLKLAQAWTKHLRVVLPEVNIKPNPNDMRPRTGK